MDEVSEGEEGVATTVKTSYMKSIQFDLITDGFGEYAGAGKYIRLREHGFRGDHDPVCTDYQLEEGDKITKVALTWDREIRKFTKLQFVTASEKVAVDFGGSEPDEAYEDSQLYEFEVPDDRSLVGINSHFIHEKDCVEDGTNDCEMV